MALQIATALKRSFLQNMKLPVVSYNLNHHLSTDIDIVTKAKEDPILNNIKESNDVMKLFSFVSSNCHRFNGEHTVQALLVLHDLTRNSRHDDEKLDIRKSAAFEQLCRSVKRHARGLDINEVITSLKVITYLEVPANTVICQTLLQLVKERINDLNIKQIMFLDFLLSKLRTSHLIDALRTALPLALQLRLRFEMDHNDVAQLTEILYYASRNKLPARSINTIVTALSVLTPEINTQSAKSIVWSLSYIDIYDIALLEKTTRLLHCCIDILVKNIDSLKYVEILTTLDKLKMRVVEQHMEYYHEDFFNACGKYAERNNLDLASSIYMADYLNRIGAPSMRLLSYISRLCSEQPDSISDLQNRAFTALLKCYSDANYKPPEWDLYKENVLNHPVLEKPLSLPWANIALALAVLQCYSHSLNEKLFNANFLKDFLSRPNNKLDYIQLLVAVAAVKAFDLNYAGPFPPSEILHQAKQIWKKHPLDEDLGPFLEKVLHGPENYIKGVQMEDGFVVDYVFALEDNGFPVITNVKKSNDEITDYNDIIFPHGCEIVSIVVFSKGCFATNTNRLKGQFELILKLLRHKGHKVIAISRTTWFKLAVSERADYIVRETNDILPDSFKLAYLSQT